jgi:hypothetical protein
VSKGEEVTGGWRKLHNEELHSLYPLLNIIRIIRSRRMRWIGHLASMGEKRKAYKFYLENLEGRDDVSDLGVDVEIILKWFLKE